MCESTENEKQILAMYDIRGIQQYIFRTTKVKDAIGASAIVENIIGRALEHAVNKLRINKEYKDITADLSWYEPGAEKPLEYDGQDKDVQILFIGGGNAYVLYRNKTLCQTANKWMSKYVIDNTYSLQLAAASVEKSENYKDDYAKIQEKMRQVKADMVMSKPLAALPVVKVEIETGYPLVSEAESKETWLKKGQEKEKRKWVEAQYKKFESCVLEKGKDSTIAVVHMDGNNMGLRIRGMIEQIMDYSKAVNKMREISFHIDQYYKKAFHNMEKQFNTSDSDINIIKVLVAGDDITYVCKGIKALATVEFFCQEINQYGMDGVQEENGDYLNGFSVCAGIAYMGSHFPFYVAYEVAEECCGSAKDRAKTSGENGNMSGTFVGNFVDFQICKNIHVANLKEIRESEYVTSYNEQLCLRPYYIYTKADQKKGLDKNVGKEYAFSKFKAYVQHFQKEISSSWAKELRNAYPLGQNQMELLCSFLQSRGWKLPENRSVESIFYSEVDGKKTAVYYDALEMMELYEPLLEKIREREAEE